MLLSLNIVAVFFLNISAAIDLMIIHTKVRGIAEEVLDSSIDEIASCVTLFRFEELFC